MNSECTNAAVTNGRRVLRRYLLRELVSSRGVKLAIHLNAELPTLWFENERGDRVIPDLHGAMPPDTPAGFIYQRSRFPRTLTETILEMVTEEEVNACPHRHIKADLGLIEGLEGRICQQCGGSQTKKVGEPWPLQWKAYGSRPMMTMNSSYPADLVLAMTRPTKKEIQKAHERGHRIISVDFDRAVLLAATACERCLNVLLWRHGLDDGYEEGSPDWEKSNTSCELCRVTTT